jgi:uncharacterized protein YndB with AHSA1/START domain
MDKTIEQTTLRFDVTVDATREEAFRVFVEDFDRIKPREHNLLAVDILETVLEPRTGGEVYDRGVDGSVCRWARVLAYEPPSRLVLAWDISPRWELETDLARASEVEIRFVPVAPGRTRVELVHSHIDRHGDGWEGFREGLAADNAWPLYLARYADALPAASR